MKLINKIVVLFLFLSGTVISQNVAKQWRFGNYAGLNFLTSPPSQVNTSSMSTTEGCASIADNNGNLLFYTDGVKIWDQTNSVMANGSGLLGNGPTFTFQAALIIKQPGSPNLYYVFTLDDIGGPNGLMYSIVDMSLAAGLGSVTAKNVPVQTPSTEKLTAVNHCNGTDVWIISHDLNGGFQNFLLSSSGLAVTPVLSVFIGSNYINYRQGAMKASPDGKHIALAASNGTAAAIIGGFELYNFDNVSGLVSNKQILYSIPYAICCEFSPDSKKLYGSYYTVQTVPSYTIFGRLLQWDLCNTTNTAIVASQSTVSLSEFNSALQLAPDGKLYATEQFNSALGIIHQPNNPAASCNFSAAAIPIMSGTVQSGLPNFNASLFRVRNSGDIIYQAAQGTLCLSYNFTASTCQSDLSDIVSANWSFGDVSSGALNTSTLTNPTHKFSAPGTYTVRVIKHYNCFSDTALKVVQATAVLPSLSVSGKTTVCVGNTTSLTVTGADTYSWSNGTTTFSLLLSPIATTVYSVTGTYTTSGCSSVKTVTVNVSPCLGIDEINNSNEVSVYPNPAGDYLIVQTTKLSILEVYDALGFLLSRSERFENYYHLDLKSFNSGILFVKVLAVNGKSSLFRIVKI